MRKSSLRRKLRSYSTKDLLYTIIDHHYTRISLASFAVCLLILNIFQINITSTKGYDIRELEDKKVQIKKDHKELEVAIFELQSMHRLNKDAKKLSVVDAQIINYIDTTPTSFALDK